MERRKILIFRGIYNTKVKAFYNSLSSDCLVKKVLSTDRNLSLKKYSTAQRKLEEPKVQTQQKFSQSACRSDKSSKEKSSFPRNLVDLHSVYQGIRNKMASIWRDEKKLLKENIVKERRLERLKLLSQQHFSRNSFNGKKSSVEKPDSPSKLIDLTNIYEDIKTRLTSLTKDEKKTKKDQWKSHKPVYSQATLKRDIYHIIESILRSEEATMRAWKLEELLKYLETRPESIVVAEKLDVTQLLLTLRWRFKNQLTLEVINQLLALLGYADPPKSRGLRILSIDGGGMRGISAIKMLRYIEKISEKQIYELFDLICGVSTGAIITCCLVPPYCMDLDQVYYLYRRMSTKVFKQSALWGTGRLVWNHAYYDTKIWESLLREYVGETGLLETNKHLRCPKVAIVSTIVNYSRAVPYVFRNYGSPYERCSEYHGSCFHTMFEAIRASAAAPTIFEEYKTGNILHQDGGLMVNNPTAMALHEARTLWPKEKISCIVSCGNGKYEPLVMTEQLLHLTQGSSSWRTILNKILQSATDTEHVHTLMADILSDKVYFRLNPHLSHEVSMDDTNVDHLKSLEEDTAMYIRRNEDLFEDVCKALLSKRSAVQICNDQIKHYSNLIQFAMNERYKKV